MIEKDFLRNFEAGAELLRPLAIKSVVRESPNAGSRTWADARILVGWEGESSTFPFVVEVRALSTPQAVQGAMDQVRRYVSDGEQPMIVVPYLSPERLQELERAGVSGVDLCGNGVVIVPGRLCVLRSGQPNLYPASRALNNPYRGRSAMVGRMLLSRPRWDSLNALAAAIREAGVDLSLPQTSKAVQAMAEDLIVVKNRSITLRAPIPLLERLATQWRKPQVRARQALRLEPGGNWESRLSGTAGLRWAFTGESSVTRYAMFSQAGPRRVAVSHLALAQSALAGKPEPVPNFAEIELLETDEPGFFFENETDEGGRRWASRLQTWLELRSGDARQQDAARDIERQLLERIVT